MTAPPEPTHPDANVLFDGFRTKLHRHPESTEVVEERRHETFRALNPRNRLQEWFSDDAALMMIRLEQIARVERRERDRLALRAEFYWDGDRRLLANELGGRLASDPAKVVPKLRATLHGCDWMIEQWGWLRGVTDAGLAWDEAQQALAVDLLGTPLRFRTSPAVLARLVDPAGLIAAEVAALEAQKAQVADADALDRSLAMADMAEPNTPEFRRLRNYEHRLQRRLRFDLEQLEMIPKFAEPHFDLVQRRTYVPQPVIPTAVAQAAAPPPEPKPEPVPPPPPPKPQTPIPPQPRPHTLPVAATLPAEPTPTSTPTRSRRPDPARLRARRAADAARQRREDRPSP